MHNTVLSISQLSWIMSLMKTHNIKRFKLHLSAVLLRWSGIFVVVEYDIFKLCSVINCLTVYVAKFRTQFNNCSLSLFKRGWSWFFIRRLFVLNEWHNQSRYLIYINYCFDINNYVALTWYNFKLTNYLEFVVGDIFGPEPLTSHYYMDNYNIK